MVSATSARPRGGRPEVPAKMTSSILPPRSDFAPCSPITQARASTTLDFPEPFGPTMQVIPGSSCRVVAEANDLNPRSVRLFKYTGAPWGSVATVGGQRRKDRRTWSGRCRGEVQRASPYPEAPTEPGNLGRRRRSGDQWPAAGPHPLLGTPGAGRRGGGHERHGHQHQGTTLGGPPGDPPAAAPVDHLVHETEAQTGLATVAGLAQLVGAREVLPV